MRRAALLLALAASACGNILGLPEGELVVVQNNRPDAPPLVPPPDAALPPDARLVTLTITKTGDGIIMSDTPGANCDVPCTSVALDVPPATRVNLTAKSSPGWFFMGWAGGSCAGIVKTCSVRVDDARLVDATFRPIQNNIIFTTSATVQGNFGGWEEAQEMCVAAAEAGGLSGTFVPWLSTSTINARDRLRKTPGDPFARGFMRMDGLAIADTIDDLTTDHRVWYPIKYDENGRENLNMAWSGSDVMGNSAPDNCDDWSSTSAMAIWANPNGGPEILSSFRWMCNGPLSIICIQVDHTGPIGPGMRAMGKMIWASKGRFTPNPDGVAGANGICLAERPAGVTSARALLATTSVAPSTLVDADTLYVRTDGIPVGTGADLANGKLRSGIWVNGDGTYAPSRYAVWNGSKAFNRMGTADETCGDWKSTAPPEGYLTVLSTQPPWWGNGTAPCTGNFWIYCVEGGPTATSYDVSLTKAAEVPNCTFAGAGATGAATVAINADDTSITANVSYSALSGPATSAHIHFGAAGVSGPVVLTFPMIGSPFIKTFVASDYVAAGGAPATFAGFVTAMKQGMAYLNVHTSMCPGGEIRAQIQ